MPCIMLCGPQDNRRRHDPTRHRVFTLRAQQHRVPHCIPSTCANNPITANLSTERFPHFNTPRCCRRFFHAFSIHTVVFRRPPVAAKHSPLIQPSHAALRDTPTHHLKVDCRAGRHPGGDGISGSRDRHRRAARGGAASGTASFRRRGAHRFFVLIIACPGI